MNAKLRINEVKANFTNRIFTNDELFEFYRLSEPDLKSTTFRWRVYLLKKAGILYAPKRGFLSLERKKDFVPEISQFAVEIYELVRAKFPYSNLCVWETIWLSKYMIHQPLSNKIIMEVDKEAAPAVFAFLQESYRDVFLNPGREEMEKYILVNQNSIIVKNMTSTSPVQEIQNIVIPKIEKIIVDIFVEDDFFITYQGFELINIYNELFISYNINQSTLKQYAHKRHVKEKLIRLLREETEITDSELLI